MLYKQTQASYLPALNPGRAPIARAKADATVSVTWIMMFTINVVLVSYRADLYEMEGKFLW